MKKNWWKFLAVILLINTIVYGFLGNVPQLPILEQSIRNLYFHVCMWMAMMVCFLISVIRAIKYLRTTEMHQDLVSAAYAEVGFLLGVLGIVTGAVWAKFTWGEFWSNDPKQLGAAIALLIYAAYLILRQSTDQPKLRAKISAVYNIFSFAMLFPTVWILPRLVESLHPGGMGNPALNTGDIDYRMRIVFYPAIIGWTLLAVWIASIKIKMQTQK